MMMMLRTRLFSISYSGDLATLNDSHIGGNKISEFRVNVPP